ncbi:GNAT family N-acetyltransferase [Marinicrinis sediminis]|uniref:GNAT family N-acetyltransferase n=1 Tax=Marinicrinis sediminis TaxID=1652465 RepID=A0ABW5R785_9BACL
MITLREAIYTDYPSILALQRTAFQIEADFLQDNTIQPMTQSLEELEREMKTSLCIVACKEGRIVGSVRASVQDETYVIAKLIVDPSIQNEGLGQRLMRAIEQTCPAGYKLKLFTGKHNHKNIYLYEKLNYKQVSEEVVTARLQFVHMEKKHTLPATEDLEKSE